MNIEVLRNFLVIADERNMTSAAKTLHISQSSLSRQMRDLEKELDTILFVRSNRDTRLTDDGLRFRIRAEEIIHLIDSTEEEFKNEKKCISGEIRIGCTECAGFPVVSRKFADLVSEYPKIKVSLISGPVSVLTSMLDENQLDFIVIREPADTQKYHAVELCRNEKAGLLLNKKLLNQEKSFLPHASVRNYPLLVPSQYTDSRFPKKLTISRREMKIIGKYDQISHASCIAENSGYALLCTDYQSTLAGNHLIFLPFEPAITYSSYLLYRRYHSLSEQAEIFLNTFINK